MDVGKRGGGSKLKCVCVGRAGCTDRGCPRTSTSYQVQQDSRTRAFIGIKGLPVTIIL